MLSCETDLAEFCGIVYHNSTMHCEPPLGGGTCMFRVPQKKKREMMTLSTPSLLLRLPPRLRAITPKDRLSQQLPTTCEKERKPHSDKKPLTDKQTSSGRFQFTQADKQTATSRSASPSLVRSAETLEQRVQIMAGAECSHALLGLPIFSWH